MEIRCFKKEDSAELVSLFRDTVYTVCKKDYSLEQLTAWAPAEISLAKFSERLFSSFSIVAQSDKKIAGFANLKNDGCIDMLFVASTMQGRGVATLLCDSLEQEARRQGFGRLYSDVSITARKFFLAKGFVIEKEYIKQVANIEFSNAIMVKDLT